MTKSEELAANARGEGCLGRSQDDEPVFVLCGRDPVAGDVLMDWAARREDLGRQLGTLASDPREQGKIANARALAKEMDRWPKKGSDENPAEVLALQQARNAVDPVEGKVTE